MDCKRCGTPLHQGVVICPECGARQRRQASSVRCAGCGSRVAVGLTVCPRCGRDVRPAGPRWGLWLTGLVALVLVGLWGLGKLQMENIRNEVSSVRVQMAELVQIFGPVSGPATPERTGQPTPGVIALAVATATPTPPAEMPSMEEGQGEAAEAETPASEPADAQTAEASPIATEPTAAATLVEPTPTETPAPTATPTRTPLPPTATATPPPTKPPAAGGQATYQVKAGDTLYGIALQYNISVDALMAANRLSTSANLQIGQTLVIPGAGTPPTPTPRPRPVASPTPSPLPATPAPYLAAPVLLNPGNQSRYNENNQILLKWDPSPGIPMGDDFWYQVVIRWDQLGEPREYADLFIHANTTETSFPGWLCGKADQPERKYQWFVRAVQLTTDGQGGQRVIPLSPASQVFSFFWTCG